MAAAAVFALMFVLDDAGALPGTDERLIEVHLQNEVPGLRARLRPGAVSADGLKVVLPGSALRDDSLEVMAGLRQLLAELGADPQVIATHGALPLSERAQQVLIRFWLPWIGLAIGVGALCRLWLGLGLVSRVLVGVAPGTPLASDGSLREMERDLQKRLAGIESTLKQKISAIESRQTSMESTAAGVDAGVGAEDGGLGALTARVQALESAPKVIPVAGEDPKIESLQKQVKSVGDALEKARDSLTLMVQWKEEMAPHLEAFGKKEAAQIEAREKFKERAKKAVAAAAAAVSEIKPLEKDTNKHWKAGWAALARQMGVRELEKDQRLMEAIKEIVEKLAQSQECSLMIEAAPKVGKGAILKALPAFFGYPCIDSNRIKTASREWTWEAVTGFDGESYHSGILPTALVEAMEHGQKSRCPWVVIDEAGEIKDFCQVISGYKENLFAKGAQERKVRLVGTNATVDVELRLPDAFRLVMARNPSKQFWASPVDFGLDQAWASRIPVVRVPPLCATSEAALLKKWIEWSRNPTADPDAFIGSWKPLEHPPEDEDKWLPGFCKVLEASRVSLSISEKNPSPGDGWKDPGWKLVETGTGITRSLIWDAAAGGKEGFLKRLESGLSKRVVKSVHFHVLERTDLERFQGVLREKGFDELASHLD